MKEIIKRILEINENPQFEYNKSLGFEAWQLNTDNKTLMELVKMGILEITLKTNRSIFYKLKDIEKAKRFLEVYNVKIDTSKPLFDSIIGYEEQKELLRRVIESEKPIHLLLLGTPATAKTLFLLELTKIPNSVYLTPYITYSGLFSYLDLEPKLILIDQLDNLKYPDVYRLLIDICEYGIATKTSYNEKIAKTIKTKIIATANDTKRIPQALLSRFLILQFKKYSEEEFINIAKQLLKDYSLSEDVKDYIIEKCKNSLDVRNVLKLANICKTKEDVDRFMKFIRFLA
jgi:Holliday junction DNA helicase RuvB